MEPVSYSPSPEDPPEPDPLCQVTPGTGMFLEVSHRMSAQVGGVCPRRPCELPRAVPREVPSRGCPTAHLAPSLPADTVYALGEGTNAESSSNNPQANAHSLQEVVCPQKLLRE